MGKYNEAIADCTLALEKDPNYLKALSRRCKCFHALGQYKECVIDAEKIYKMDNSRGKILKLIISWKWKL
jgi:Tetratricopeptide repeat.